MPPPSSIVVTGAAGFLGSRLAAHLSALEFRIVAVDHWSSATRWSRLAELNLADCWDAADFRQRLASSRSGRGIGAIVHLGACSSTLEDDLGMLMDNNYAYTRDLARWCLGNGVRFIYASSAATYGDGSSGYADDLERLPRLRPLNRYAFSKHAFDLWAWRHGAFSTPGAAVGLKYFNVYGPNEEHKGAMRSMVLKAFEQIAAAGVVRLFKSHRPDCADGEQTRDFLYVDDAVAATAWFLQHPEATGIFNIGSGVARSWNELAEAAFAACGRPPRIEYVEMPEAIRSSYQYATCADISRLRAAGCPLLFRSLNAGVDEYARRLRAQEAAL